MPATPGRPPTIAQYIASRPREVQAILRRIRRTIRSAAPGATEAIRYGIPTFVLDGTNLVHFAACKRHIGFYPTPSAIQAFAPELARYKGARGSVQFPLEEAIPLDLIRTIVLFRVGEIREEGKAEG